MSDTEHLQLSRSVAVWLWLVVVNVLFFWMRIHHSTFLHTLLGK